MAEIKMPKLGESVTEGTLGRWLKKVGDSIEKYEPIAEVITDKVTAEVPSDFVGVLKEILVQENETVSVGTVIAIVEEAGAATASVATPLSASVTEVAAPTEQGSVASAGPGERVASSAVQPMVDTGTNPERSERGRYSPAVLTLAAERGIDLAKVNGSGLGGRITRKDVLAYVPAAAEPTVQVPAPAPSPVVTPAAAPVAAPTVAHAAAASQPANEEWIAITPIRRRIAERMVESKHEAPHAWMMVEVDVTSLARLREAHKATFKAREGVELTFLPFFIKAAVESLKEFPMLNSSWAGDKIVLKKDINISVAVATDNALVVPVIRGADGLSILGLAKAIADLARRARAGRLLPEDMQGGTFTVNNTGAFGSIMSQPIINAPQAAILSVESIVKRPVVQKDDSIAVRSMVNLCLSLDHRVLDGWVVGQFMRSVKRRLEAINEQTNLF